MGEFSNNATVASSDCEMKIFQAELPILLLVSAIANLVAMVTQVRMLHSLKSKNMWLLILLTGNDLFMSVVLLTSIIVNTVTCNRFHANRLCDLLGWLGAGSFSLSIFLILAINMERFLMIVFPLFHHKHVTPVRIAILFFVGEFLALVPLGLPLVGVGSPYLYYANNKLCLFDFSAWETNNPTHAKLILINSLYMILLILLVTAANIATIRRLHRRNTHIQTHTHRIHSMGNTIRMAKRFSLLIKVVAFVNCICTMPFFIKLICDYVSYDTTLEGVDDSITTMLLFLTPIVNPFLYLFFNKMYRQYLLSPIIQVFPCLKFHQNRVAPSQHTATNGMISVLHTSQL